MKSYIKLSLYYLVLGCILTISSCGTKKYDALIVTGQSNKSHHWKASHNAVKQIINNTGLFSVDVVISPEQGADMSSFTPDFKSYDVVIIDYDAIHGPIPPRQILKNMSKMVVAWLFFTVLTTAFRNGKRSTK